MNILSGLLQSEKTVQKRRLRAENLLAEFGDLKSVFFASKEDSLAFSDLSPDDVRRIENTSLLVEAILQSELSEKPLLNNLDKVMAYCHVVLAGKAKEQFDCLFLDKSLRLMAHSCIQVGTTDHVAVYPRELFGKALRYNASALILVHNHPSANAVPSKADISMTGMIAKIGKLLGITVADHIIVSRKEVFSFRKECLI